MTQPSNESPTSPLPNSSTLAGASQWSRLVSWCQLKVRRLSDPETICSTAIVVVVGLMAGVQRGPILLLLFLVVALTAHVATIEVGNYSMLWIATALLLVFVAIAMEPLLQNTTPLLLTFGGSVVLVHNELVKINFARRRNGILDKRAFSSSAVGVGAASAIGIAGIAFAEALPKTRDRNWLWFAGAFAVVSLFGLVVVLVPVRNSTAKDKETFRPGERIPPQPLASESVPGT